MAWRWFIFDVTHAPLHFGFVGDIHIYIERLRERVSIHIHTNQS